jgi:hypothetical protein
LLKLPLVPLAFVAGQQFLLAFERAADVHAEVGKNLLAQDVAVTEG